VSTPGTHKSITNKDRATELNSKSALDKYCRLRRLSDTQLLASWEQKGCDSTTQKTAAESAASLKANVFKSIMLKLPQRQRVVVVVEEGEGVTNNTSSISANKNGAHTLACRHVDI
jgi:hypothetical protein